MRGLILVVAALVFFTNSANARGGGGGHNTAFDPNSYGGGWTCFRSLASGTCGDATSHYFDAPCDGVSSDSTALAAWTAYATALNPTVVKLYVPPGSICNFTFKNTISFDGAINTGIGITNAIWWVYGTSANIIDVGGQLFFQDGVHSAKIDTVAAGATSVVVNDGNVARFTAGDWIMVTGDLIEAGDGGYPPAFAFYETIIIAAIVGNTISFNQPLRNSYKSTWPNFTLGSSMGTGGAATIFKLPSTWNSNFQIFGLTITNPNSTAINYVLRNSSTTDVVAFRGPVSPSGVQSFFSFYSSWLGGSEIDKDADLIHFYRGLLSTGAQTASPQTFVLDSLQVFCSMNGTAVNTIMRNVTVSLRPFCDGRIAVGPTLFGPGTSLLLDNVTFPLAAMSQIEMEVAGTSYADGVFAVAKSCVVPVFCINHYATTFVPGHKVKFAWHNSSSNACTPLTVFTVSDIREDASNYYVDTTNWTSAGSPIATPSAIPTPDCTARGAQALAYVAYPAATIRQINSPGQPSMTQFSAPFRRRAANDNRLVTRRRRRRAA